MGSTERFTGKADFVAQGMDYEVSSFGATEGEALAKLREAVALYLEDLPG